MDAIFVGGHSRSGTTLMQGLLCATAQTGRVSREVSYLRALMEALDLGQRWWDIHTHDFFHDRAELDAMHAETVRRWLVHAQARLGPGRLVQKEPRLTDHFGALGRLLPEATFVVMVRDLRDVVASQQVRAQKKGKTVELSGEVQRWARTFHGLAKSDLGERLIYVRYEALVQRPHATLRELGGRLSLPLEAVARARWPTVRQPGEESASALDGRPVQASRVGAWHQDLPQGWARAIDGQRARLVELAGVDPWDHDGQAVFTGEVHTPRCG